MGVQKSWCRCYLVCCKAHSIKSEYNNKFRLVVFLSWPAKIVVVNLCCGKLFSELKLVTFLSKICPVVAHYDNYICPYYLLTHSSVHNDERVTKFKDHSEVQNRQLWDSSPSTTDLVTPTVTTHASATCLPLSFQYRLCINRKGQDKGKCVGVSQKVIPHGSFPPKVSVSVEWFVDIPQTVCLPLSKILSTRSVIFNCSVFTKCEGLTCGMRENAYCQRMGFSAPKVENQRTKLRVAGSSPQKFTLFSYPNKMLRFQTNQARPGLVALDLTIMSVNL